MTKRPTKQKAEDTQQPDGPALWLSILRKASNVSQLWRRCDRRSCRRAKRCMASSLPLRCDACRPPSPPISDYERVRAKHDLRRALEQRLAQIERDAGK